MIFQVLRLECYAFANNAYRHRHYILCRQPLPWAGYASPDALVSKRHPALPAGGSYQPLAQPIAPHQAGDTSCRKPGRFWLYNHLRSSLKLVGQLFFSTSWRPWQHSRVLLTFHQMLATVWMNPAERTVFFGTQESIVSLENCQKDVFDRSKSIIF